MLKLADEKQGWRCCCVGVLPNAVADSQVYVDTTNGMADIKLDGSPNRMSPFKQQSGGSAAHRISAVSAGGSLSSPRSPGLSPISKGNRGSSRLYGNKPSPTSSPLKGGDQARQRR
jgi:hypothetical protein